jgi:hypothetical protein
VRDVFDVVDHFGGDEEVFAFDVRFFNRDAELGLGVVELGAVEVCVAEFDGLPDCVDRAAVDGIEVAAFEEGGAGAVADLEGG